MPPPGATMPPPGATMAPPGATMAPPGATMPPPGATMPPQPPRGNPPPIHMLGGTTYFDPELQKPNPSWSPIRRPKAAIPIVNPQVQ